MSAYHTRSPQETFDLGKSFALRLRPGAVVAVTGNLGSGKTRFISGVCAGLGVDGHVASPTFTLINEYEGKSGRVIHIDLYRISRKADVDELGLYEYFNGASVCLIEWPGIIADMLPPERFEVTIGYGTGDMEREIEIEEVVKS